MGLSHSDMRRWHEIGNIGRKLWLTNLGTWKYIMESPLVYWQSHYQQKCPIYQNSKAVRDMVLLLMRPEAVGRCQTWGGGGGGAGVRIRWGQRSMGWARPRHRNNFDFDFDGGVGGGDIPPTSLDRRLIGPPPHLATKTTMMADSAGGPAVIF